MLIAVDHQPVIPAVDKGDARQLPVDRIEQRAGGALLGGVQRDGVLSHGLRGIKQRGEYSRRRPPTFPAVTPFAFLLWKFVRIVRRVLRPCRARVLSDVGPQLLLPGRRYIGLRNIQRSQYHFSSRGPAECLIILLLDSGDGDDDVRHRAPMGKSRRDRVPGSGISDLSSPPGRPLWRPTRVRSPVCRSAPRPRHPFWLQSAAHASSPAPI